MNKSLFTYKKSGVDINSADRFVNFIAKNSSKKKGKKKLKNIGGFGSISSIPKNLKNPKLVACTDGVGTKIEIANELKIFNTIGIDLVAMCVNDIITSGAKPLFFLASATYLVWAASLKSMPTTGWMSNSRARLKKSRQEAELLTSVSATCLEPARTASCSNSSAVRMP